MQLSHGLLSFEQLQGMRSEFVLDTSQVSEKCKLIINVIYRFS